MRKWQCRFCSHVYDEAVGDPGNDVAPGTPIEQLPEAWFCPDCGATAEDYDLIDEHD